MSSNHISNDVVVIEKGRVLRTSLVIVVRLKKGKVERFKHLQNLLLFALLHLHKILLHVVL